MYIPKINAWLNDTQIKDFIKRNNFVTLCANDTAGKIHAVHIPVLLQEHETFPILHGHVAKGNPLCDCIENNKQALIIFQGAHSYISSSWYANENVSTWNYISVHVYGTLQKLTEEELIASVTQLTHTFEQGRDNARTVDTLSPKMFARELRGIVGFKLGIEHIDANKKLSQNRDDLDYKKIVTQLSESTDANEKLMSVLMQAERMI